MSLSEWVLRQPRTEKARQPLRKYRHGKRSRLRFEELESRRLLALITQGLPNGGVLITPDPQMQWLDMSAPSQDLDYYSLTLTFTHSNQVQYSWTRLTQNDDKAHPAPTGTAPFYPTTGNGTIDATPGLGPSIEFRGNDPAKTGNVNSLNLIDLSGNGVAPAGTDETFLMSEWKDFSVAPPTATALGQAIDYDTDPTADDATPTPHNITVVWYNTPFFSGKLGGNSSGKTQPLTIFDNSGPVLGGSPTGGDRFAIGATDALTATTLGGGVPVPVYPGHFLPPTASGFMGDEYDITSDALPLGHDGPDFNGDLNSILGPLTILQRAGQGTIILNDKANKTIAAPKNVLISSALDKTDPTGLQVIGTIKGFAGPAGSVPIIFENIVPADPYNPPALISTISVTLVGADAAPTTLPPPGSPYATYTITGTLEFAKIAGQPTWANNLTIDGGASGFNEFDVQASTANVVALSTGDGSGNVVNLASDAPKNAADMTKIKSSVVVNGGAAACTVNLIDLTDPNPVTATAAVVTGSGASDQLQNGVVYTQITGFTPATISLSQAAGGQLSANVFGSQTQPLNFNLQSDSVSALALTTGDADGNHVVLSSTALLATGNVDGIISAVTINFGMGKLNTLDISDATGATAVGARLENDATGTYNQITGFTSPLIQYSLKAGGHLDVSLFGSNTVPATFTVASTLGATTTLALTGGTNGGDTFNIQTASASTLTINTGDGDGNAVNITKAGDLTGIASAVSVHSGAQRNSLAVTNSAGSSGAAVTLTNGQIAGWTSNPVVYDEVTGGSLAISLVGPKAAGTAANPNSFLVTSTLPAGNSVALTGGLGGFNAFNVGSTATANSGLLNLIGAAISVNGGAGPNNNLEIDDHGSSGAFNYSVTGSKVTTALGAASRPFGGVTYSNVRTLQLDATDQRNVINVAPSATTTYAINGWGPTATGLPGGNVAIGAGDVLTIDFTGTLGAHFSQTAVPAGGDSFNGGWTFSNRMAVTFNSIEDFPVPIVAYGADASASGKPMVKVLRLGSSDVISTFNAFPNEPTFHGGVRVATGYFDSSGHQEIAVVPGAGHVPIVKVFDRLGNLLYSFNPGYASNFRGGFNIAVGNIEGIQAANSEIDDIVTVPSSGVSDIRVFDKISTAPTLYREFTAWGTRFIGGSSLAVGDLNLDGRGDVIVGSGPGMAPTIDAFDVTANAKVYVPFRVLTPFGSGFRGGVNVSTISAGSGIASPLVVASQGISATPTVQIFNGLTGATVNSSTPFSRNGSSAPVRTVVRLVNGHLVVFAAQQTKGNSTAIRQFDLSNPSAGYVDYILETDPNFLSGVYLG